MVVVEKEDGSDGDLVRLLEDTGTKLLLSEDEAGYRLVEDGE